MEEKPKMTGTGEKKLLDATIIRRQMARDWTDTMVRQSGEDKWLDGWGPEMDEYYANERPLYAQGADGWHAVPLQYEWHEAPIEERMDDVCIRLNTETNTESSDSSDEEIGGYMVSENGKPIKVRGTMRSGRGVPQDRYRRIDMANIYGKEYEEVADVVTLRNRSAEYIAANLKSWRAASKLNLPWELRDKVLCMSHHSKPGMYCMRLFQSETWKQLYGPETETKRRREEYAAAKMKESHFPDGELCKACCDAPDCPEECREGYLCREHPCKTCCSRAPRYWLMHEVYGIRQIFYDSSESDETEGEPGGDTDTEDDQTPAASDGDANEVVAMPGEPWGENVITGEKQTIHLYKGGKRVLIIKMRPTQKLGKLMKAYCAKYNVDQEDCRFIYNNDFLRGNQTPQEVGIMEENAIIRVGQKEIFEQGDSDTEPNSSASGSTSPDTTGSETETEAKPEIPIQRGEKQKPKRERGRGTPDRPGTPESPSMMDYYATSDGKSRNYFFIHYGQE